jgi:outer membrane lipoprotein carrier protein
MILLTVAAFAVTDTLKSFDADFEQRITDENNRTVVYTGHLWAETANRARWEYRTPVTKTIIIQNRNVLMVEPDLEQAVVRTLDEEIDFFSILSRAQKVSQNQYEAQYRSQRYEIGLDGTLVESIRYRDGFDNRIELRFSHQKQNTPIAPAVYDVVIPEFYDVIR